MNIRKDDNVKMRRGRDRNKTGKVVSVDTKGSTAIVQGLNMFKKHARPKRQGEKGEMVQIAKPIPMSVLSVVCPNCHLGTRVGSKVEKGQKVRYCKRCKAII